ncbi:nicotinamidase [Lichenibacterium ramalinae]|uniref:nicotinamidase n=1 Tax=Lichenibacterium ramalinae TaxID=2316527 RepID=A0A4V1RIJ4_9HYPH|nr:nicotinamidase [Lichenibacterium ramalinae]RYB04162.1 nicotinamidase [Lichenibacterium ramalinae]
MIRIDPETDVLGLIDIQPTFMPGGELPVAGGDAVVPIAARLARDVFAHAFATQDWHPAGHVSFASTHGAAPFSTIALPYGDQVLWPDHAVIGSAGAALHRDLPLDRVEAIVRKGFRPGIDSYSAFRDNDRTSLTGLGGWVKERGFRRLFFCGLALDFCVFWSAQDARALGYDVVVVEDACRAIAAPAPGGGTTLDAARAALRASGVQLVDADGLVPA